VVLYSRNGIECVLHLNGGKWARLERMLDLERLVFGSVDLPLHAREEAHQEGYVAPVAASVADDSQVPFLDGGEPVEELEDSVDVHAEGLETYSQLIVTLFIFSKRTRLCARSWLSGNLGKTALRLLEIVRMYYDTQ
jgi:hypothetical protein